MIAGKILAAEFPQSGIQVPDVDHVASGIAYLDAVAYAKRPANQNVNPRDETFHRRLHSQSDDDRANTERSDRCVPIYKNNRDDNDRYHEDNSQARDTLERETSSSILDSSDSVKGKRARDGQHDCDQRCAARDSLSETEPTLRQRNDFRADEKIKSCAQSKNDRVANDPKSVAIANCDLFATFLPRRPLELFANFGSFTKFFCRFGHHNWNRTGRRNRPHAPRQLPSSKPLNRYAETNLNCVIKRGHCGAACAPGGT